MSTISEGFTERSTEISFFERLNRGRLALRDAARLVSYDARADGQDWLSKVANAIGNFLNTENDDRNLHNDIMQSLAERAEQELLWLDDENDPVGRKATFDRVIGGYKGLTGEDLQAFMESADYKGYQRPGGKPQRFQPETNEL